MANGIDTSNHIYADTVSNTTNHSKHSNTNNRSWHRRMGHVLLGDGLSRSSKYFDKQFKQKFNT